MDFHLPSHSLAEEIRLWLKTFDYSSLTLAWSSLCLTQVFKCQAHYNLCLLNPPIIQSFPPHNNNCILHRTGRSKHPKNILWIFSLKSLICGNLKGWGEGRNQFLIWLHCALKCFFCAWIPFELSCFKSRVKSDLIRCFSTESVFQVCRFLVLITSYVLKTELSCWELNGSTEKLHFLVFWKNWKFARLCKSVRNWRTLRYFRNFHLAQSWLSFFGFD